MINQTTNNATATEQELEDVRDIARIETATRFLTTLVFVLLGVNTLILVGVAAILALLMHALIVPLTPLGGP